ncbi:MAG TPA: hypothetical protein VI357_00675 [Mycobacteriales bacterium]
MPVQRDRLGRPVQPGSRKRASAITASSPNGTVTKYVTRGEVQPASSPPATALVASAALSTRLTRPIQRSYPALEPVSSTTVS